jgi:putative ABC transport system permease protein
MLRNYFIVAWRNLIRSKWYSLINTLGLSIGMAVALLIGLWIWDELSFDHYYPNHSRITEVMTTQTFNGQTGTGAATSIPLAPALRTHYASDLPEVARASWNFDHILAVGDKKLTESGSYVEPGFTRIVPLRMVRGRDDALKDPSSILLSHSAAMALFGSDDILNRTLKVDNKVLLRVAGVYDDPPRNSSFYDTKFLAPWDNYVSQNNWMKGQNDNWGNHSWRSFALLAPHADAAAVTAKIKDIAKPHNKDGNEQIVLFPMDSWHLYEYKDGKLASGRLRFVWLFGIIGVFVLLLACINFMNLSTARSEKRAKEVGIRKTIGSLRGQLIAQFLCESLVVSLLAFVFAIGWVLLALPFFNTLADKEMHLPWCDTFILGDGAWLCGLYRRAGGQLPGLLFVRFQADQGAEGFSSGGKICFAAPQDPCRAPVYSVGGIDHRDDPRLFANQLCKEPAGGLYEGGAPQHLHEHPGHLRSL